MASDRFIAFPELSARYGGKTRMTISRWVKEKKMGFPAPLSINGHNFWRESELIEFEKRLEEKRDYRTAESQTGEAA